MNKKLTVKKSNSLIMSSYNLSLIEHRFLNMCIGRIYYQDKIVPETKCTVFLERYAQEYKVTRKEAYSQFNEIKISLLKQTIRNLGDEESTINIAKEIEFITNDEIYVKFDNEFIGHISLLTSYFTTYAIEEVASFKSEHSFRIFEICKSVAHDKAKWECIIEVDKLKSMLNLDGKYTQYGSFKRMIDQCIDEINLHTKLTVSLEESRLRRRVSRLVFKVKSN